MSPLLLRYLLIVLAIQLFFAFFFPFTILLERIHDTAPLLFNSSLNRHICSSFCPPYSFLFTHSLFQTQTTLSFPLSCIITYSSPSIRHAFSINSFFQCFRCVLNQYFGDNSCVTLSSNTTRFWS